MSTKRKTLLAARVEPWQLFKFKKIVKWRRTRPGIVLMEALQFYSNYLNIPEKTMREWLEEYHKESKDVD